MPIFLKITFIVMTIYVIAIGQLFYLKSSLIEDQEEGTHYVFAQPSNTSIVMTPSNIIKRKSL
jgi:hypothetical protein